MDCWCRGNPAPLCLILAENSTYWTCGPNKLFFKHKILIWMKKFIFNIMFYTYMSFIMRKMHVGFAFIQTSMMQSRKQTSMSSFLLPFRENRNNNQSLMFVLWGCLCPILLRPTDLGLFILFSLHVLNTSSWFCLIFCHKMEPIEVRGMLKSVKH